MSGALAFVAGLGAGYMKQKQTNIENERQAKLDAQREQEFQWRADEQKRLNDERQSVAQASKPIAMEIGAGGMVKPDYMDNADVGQPNEGALLPGGYKVQGKSYTDQAAAQAEVTKQNTPEAIASRVGAAMRSHGNVQGAMNLEHAGLQIESAKDQLAKSKEQSAHDKAFRSVVTRFQKDGWAGIPAIYADYKDGHTATVQEDGKGGAVVTRIGPDGQPVGSKAFTSPMEFITDQLANLEPKLYVSTVQHKEDKKQAQSNSDRDHELKKKEVDSKIELRGAQAENMALRGALAASRAGGQPQQAGEPAPFNPLHDFDQKQARKSAMDQAMEEAKNAAAAAGGKPVSEADIARRSQSIYGSMRDAAAADNTKSYYLQVASNDLKASSSDPAAYAATYQKALAKGILPQQLVSMGFKPPMPIAALTNTVAPTDEPEADPAAAIASDPLAGKGRQQIRELKQELATERQRWVGKANADGRIAEIDALINRIDRGQY